MILINPREIAAQVLLEVLEEGAYNNTALRRALRQNGAMPQKDKALVTEMVNGTLRNLYYIDHVINTFSTLKAEKMKPWILAVLRTALYQMFFLNIPDSAACNEAVKLVEERGLGQLKGFVNGLLREIGRKKNAIPMPDENTAAYLVVKYSHPLWLVRMWIAYYGYEETKALCVANNLPPDVSIRVNSCKTNSQALTKELVAEGIQVQAGILSPLALHLKGMSDLSKLSAFEKGLFYVQDESSQLAVQVLDPKKGERVLDLCGAPGGKSFLIAQMMEDVGTVVSCDIYEHKVELIEEGAVRLGLRAIKTEENDATQWREEWNASFDRVLVDAPCSGLGLIGKKPDIRLKKSGDEIDALVPIQREILERGAGYVKPDGILVYSTCTLCRKENEKNIEWFLKNHPEFSAEAIATDISEKIDSDTGEKGYVTLMPHRTKTDGFFIARMRRKG